MFIKYLNSLIATELCDVFDIKYSMMLVNDLDSVNNSCYFQA